MKIHFRLGLLLLMLLVVFLFNRCRKDAATAPPVVPDVHFLGHKGSGSTLINPSIIENTLPAVQKGLSTLEGVELDVQMSLDGTLWLFHDLNLASNSCNAMIHKTIILSRDADISKINICSPNTQDRIFKLSEIISYWNLVATPFYMSLHIKLDFPADSINNPSIGGEALYLAKFADNLAKVIPSVKAPGKIMLEVYDATFCKKIQKLIPGIKVCMIKDVTFTQQINDALALGYDGVSCYFVDPTLTVSEVARAHESGLIVHLWTPDSQLELLVTYNYHPDFIQTNNLNALADLNIK